MEVRVLLGTPHMLSLATPVENLYLVGPARAKLLGKLGIQTLGDLLFYFPRAHNDLSKITPIKDLVSGETANIKARVLDVKSFRTKIKRLTLTQALLEDGTGTILSTWFNQPFLSRVIKKHETFLFSGKVVSEKNKLILQNPIYEIEKKEQIHTARLVPVYRLTAELTPKILRTIIKTYLDQTPIPEYLPEEIIRAEKLYSENQAVKTFHFPKDFPSLIAAQTRLAFDEIFQTQLRVLKHKLERQKANALYIKPVPELKTKIAALPFALTGGQLKSLSEIILDFQKPFPANRLLEGDVGSGKTVIALLTMWLVARNDLQSALLSPTEVLALQHYDYIREFFAPDDINTALLTSAVQKINGQNVIKQQIYDGLKSGEIKIVVGTHALLQETVNFANLALVVIDEQHRFGVAQRAQLKKLHNTHLITMSATPIPRSLALTLYGDLDISILSELPGGRKKILTKLVPEDKRAKAYEFIKQQLNDGRQAFVICPLVEETDKLGVKSATAEYERLKTNEFAEFPVGLLHGKMKPAEKERVMNDFKNNQTKILIATSVIEVGVDVPNATVMLIEGAERFGLAQLHQFRGRVGRSTHQSYCFLFSGTPDAETNPRLQAFLQSQNGFELAEKDLHIRGSGDLYGTTQSGYGFRIATLSNLDMVERSRKLAETLLRADLTLKNHPLLAEKLKNQPLVHLE